MLDISLSTGPAAFGSEFAQIRYSYNPHEVAAAGLIEEFQVFTFDTASGEWVPVDKVVDDIDNTQFNGFSSHFSAFVPAAAMAAPGTLAPPPSCIVDDFPAGIGGSAMADFFTVGESFTYYQDRTYTVVPTAASTQNAITFATFGFEGALGITICNGNSSCGPFSAHKHYAGDDYVNFIAHTDLDVYAMYDTRGGVNPVDTSEDAPWLAAAGFVDTGYFIETTDAVGLYTVYKNTYLQGQTVALHGNRKGVTDFAINTNYWVVGSGKSAAFFPEILAGWWRASWGPSAGRSRCRVR